MRIGLLGGLEVLDDEGRDVLVAGPKLRALLAVLALQPGRVVSAEQLIDALWGENPPTEVRNGLQGLASKLRRTLGSADLVAMRGAGYALELAADAVDVHRFEELVVEARAAAVDGDPNRAAALLAEADALWRGDPLADFVYDDFAAGAITRLSELRLAAIEERLDLELQLGRHQAAVAELEELVAAEPLRERLRGLLMIALYRAGRQADALRVFQDGRHLLAEELGLEPGHELRELEGAILGQDRSLDAPAIVRSDATSHAETYSIPEALTPLVGRDAELRELTRLTAEHRFVTLVGPGGVGKTRLALEVARAGSAALAFGACLVELAPVGDPAGVRAAIALAFPDPGRLAEVIGDREMLIVLDNCEHVITTAAEVAEDLLRRCTALRLLATSREGLRVGGETIWPVPPLAAGDAVSLFAARAQAAGAPLELSDDNRTVIADICSRLDGLPLAIELAAARTRAFPLQQISARLNDRFRLLTGGSRTALPRQQTLRAVVDWSYELLFDDEQRVFERLSVFPGGCDLATAEAVCADDVLAADDLADLIQALVEKSLVIAVPRGDAVRFTQLQTLCQYGRERLAERGDAVRIRDAMAKHYAELCAQSAVAYTGDRQRAWLTAIDQEHDNLRAALDWAIANDDAETALTIAGGTSWRHWLAGMVIEGKRWLDDAFGCAGDAAERTRGLALTGRGLLDFLAGARDHCDDDLEAALEIFRRHNDVESTALAYSFYAELPNARGDLDEARRRRLILLDSYGASPVDPFAIAGRAYSLGKLALMDGDLAEAEVQYRAAAEGFSRIDRPVMLSMSLDVVADFDERAGDYRAAVRALDKAIATNDACGLRGFTGSLLARLGWALLHEGDFARAETTYQRALDGAARLRSLPVMFLALTGMAVLHRVNRDDRAAAAATEALELYRAGDPRRFRNRIDPENELRVAAAACCIVLAALAAEGDRPEPAAVLLGQAERLRAESGAGIPAFQHDDMERARRTVISALGADGFAAAFERGRSSAEAALSS